MLHLLTFGVFFSHSRPRGVLLRAASGVFFIAAHDEFFIVQLLGIHVSTLGDLHRPAFGVSPLQPLRSAFLSSFWCFLYYVTEELFIVQLLGVFPTPRFP